ncbi:YceH family protein [Geomonas subterranea]|uniref:YceH family protein n=1 Tax=Geomonas subterranea TaxID=2847989 RepID=A0ABX8LCU0_9BACT|nr:MULTISPECIES: YceH family protein [Geomonas]QXE89842.1 YceH family protein [Geomonas subterranea]QXM08040.1 YceH family protein [Geomonas subterranea]
MRMNLSELEIRILGCLMEKELTTPEYYPLTLNALAAACNQKSNRDPVLSFSEPDLQRGLEALGARGLARLTTTGGRVNKYVHSMGDKLGLSAPARAVLAELMLRGPQTAAELRSRCQRMTEVGNLVAVEEILLGLQQHGPSLVVRLPRQAGRKEPRYAQVFAGMPELPEEEPEAPAAPSAPRTRPGGERLEHLEQEVGSLRQEIAELRREVEELLAAFS